MIHKLAAAAATAGLVATSAGVAGAVEQPVVAPGPPPADPAPAPDQAMKQVAPCTVTGVLPGSDLRELPEALQLLNMPGAWKQSTGVGQIVAVIDTGVAPNPRLPHLVAGGDYVMGGYGDGTQDCDGHGTLIASLIGAAPSGDPLRPEPTWAEPAPAPPGAPAPQPVPPPPPPPTITMTQTVTSTPPPPPPPPPPAPPPPSEEAQPCDQGIPGMCPAWVLGDGVPIPVAPPPGGGPDGLIGVAPDAVVVTIRQSAQTFGLASPSIDQDPQDVRRAGDINALTRAIVHAANMGARVINISVVACIPADKPQDQDALGAAIRYAAVDRDVVIVAAAGNTHDPGCNGQNPDPLPTDPDRGWGTVKTVATPAWFSDYVLAVSATDSAGAPAQNEGASLHGPWVGLAAPGADIVGLSTTGQVINGAVYQDKLSPLAGSSFATAIVSGIAADVRAKHPNLSAAQIIHRLEVTARPPAGGRDNVVGYGVVDPLAALTWDVPGEVVSVAHEKLMLPPHKPKPDPWPRRVSLVIMICSGLAAAVLSVRTVVKRRRSQM